VTAAVSLTGTPRDLQDSRRFGVTLSHSKRRLGILVEKKKNRTSTRATTGEKSVQMVTSGKTCARCYESCKKKERRKRKTGIT
jgi:hypothetical protein